MVVVNNDISYGISKWLGLGVAMCRGRTRFLVKGGGSTVKKLEWIGEADEAMLKVLLGESVRGG